MSKTFGILIKACIYLLVFLVPIFFLTFTVEPFEFNKIYLAFFLVSIAFLVWLAGMIFTERQIRLNRTPLDFIVILFLACMGLSVAFSQDRIVGWFGFYGRFWPSFIGLATMVVFYFLLTNNVRAVNDKTEASRHKVLAFSLLKTLCVSCLLVLLVAFFSFFGVWPSLLKLIGVPLPGLMNIRIFNTLGGSLIDSFEMLSLFLSFVLTLFVCYLALKEKGEKIWFSILGYILFFGILVFLLIVDFWPAWLSLVLGLGLFLLIAFIKRLFKSDVSRLGLPVFLTLVAVAAIFFNPVRQILPTNQVLNSLPRGFILNNLNQKESWIMVLKAVKEHPLFGSGLGNFSYIFSKFKPSYQNDFWDMRLDRGVNHLAETLGTTGIIGFLSYLAVLGMFLVICWVFLSSSLKKGSKGQDKPNEPNEAENKPEQDLQISWEQKSVVICFLAGFFTLFAGQFFYYQNFTLAFGFWLAMGIAAGSWGSRRKEKVFSFKNFPEAGLVASVMFWLLLAVFSFAGFVMLKYYAADVYFKTYLSDPVNNLSKLEKAARLADSQPIYHTSLAMGYIQKFSEEISKQDLNRDVALKLLVLAADEAKKALEISPNQVGLLESAGAIYRQISDVDKKALELGIKSLTKAQDLEPNNPSILTELGKLYLANDDSGKARQYFELALAKRSNFVFASMQLASLDEVQGNIKQAQERLEQLLQRLPFSLQQISNFVEIEFSLGRMYYNEKDYEKAKKSFEFALSLFPKHSNSLYSLALVYEKQGDKQKAIELLEKVLELNPDNKDVLDKIEKIKNPNVQPEPEKESESATSTEE